MLPLQKWGLKPGGLIKFFNVSATRQLSVTYAAVINLQALYDYWDASKKHWVLNSSKFAHTACTKLQNGDLYFISMKSTERYHV
jgi:hypothetical protein